MLNLECFIPEENNPYPLCVGKGWKECEECQLRTEYEPKDPYGAGRQICFKAMEIMEESENYAVPTFYDDTCDDWEEKK